MLLLDTHAWIWCVNDDQGRLGRRARQILSRADTQGLIRISPVSIFEVMALHTSGRLRLLHPPEQWIRDALDSPSVGVAEVTPAIAIDAGAMPRTALTDPVDRLLVATARQLGATLLTSDRAILDYASKAGTVRVHDLKR